MKQWAIIRPDGTIVKNTIRAKQSDAWEEATYWDQKLHDLNFNPVTSVPEYINQSEAKGYRCGRVDVTVITNK